MARRKLFCSANLKSPARPSGATCQIRSASAVKFTKIARARSKMRCRACSVSLSKANWFLLVRHEIAEYLRTQWAMFRGQVKAAVGHQPMAEALLKLCARLIREFTTQFGPKKN